MIVIVFMKNILDLEYVTNVFVEFAHNEKYINNNHFSNYSWLYYS